MFQQIHLKSSFQKYKKKHPNLIKTIKVILIGDTVPQKILHFYIYLILFGAIILYLPFSLTSYHSSYSKIINEDFCQSGKFNALYGSVILKEYVDKLTPEKPYFLLPNTQDIYLVKDPINQALKVIKVAPYTFWDSLFTTVSAFSDTGLSTSIIRSTYSVFGQVVIILLIQIGGVGFVVIAFLLWKIFRSRKSDNQNTFTKSIILRAERGNSKLGGTTKTIIVAVIFIFVIELIYAIFYSLYFNFVPAYEQQLIGSSTSSEINIDPNLISIDSEQFLYVYNSPYSIWAGIFHSISTMNNAGFDILGGYSISPYKNDINAIFLFISMTEFIIGGIGYPVIFDLYEFICFKKIFGCKRKYKFSLFTKISLITSLVISIIGFVIVSSVEATSQNGLLNLPTILYNDKDKIEFSITKPETVIDIQNVIYGNNHTFNSIWGILFETMSTRSAGFSVSNNFLYTDASKSIYIALMFIGAAPSSTAGGIRTTTFAIVCMGIWSKLRGREQVRMFKRAVNKKIVSDSFSCFILIIIILPLLSIITDIIMDASTINTKLRLIDIIYEFTSAFGTAGLTTGLCNIITEITIVPYIFMVFLMFIGQLGVSTTLLTWVKKNPNGNLYLYPDEDLKIG